MGGSFSSKRKIHTESNYLRESTKKRLDNQRILSPDLKDLTFEPGMFYQIRDKNLNIDSLVEHYMPPEFPMVDMITNEDIERCQLSWTILSSESHGLLVQLVDEFYFRLIVRASEFNSIFSNVRERATILTKALTFVLSVNQLPKAERAERYKVTGSLHRHLDIPNWMFSTYMSTLIETISFVLLDKASIEMIESWTRVCSFSLRLLLENTIDRATVRSLEYASTHCNTDAKRLLDKTMSPMSRKNAESVSQASSKTLHKGGISRRGGAISPTSRRGGTPSKVRSVIDSTNVHNLSP